MSVLEDQIARICSQVPHNARIKLTIEFEDSSESTSVVIQEARPTAQATPGEKRRYQAHVIKWLENALATSEAPDFSFELLDSAQIGKRMAREGREPLRGIALHRMLKRAGFVFLGLIRGAGDPANFWSVYPENFTDKNGVVVRAKVRDHLDQL